MGAGIARANLGRAEAQLGNIDAGVALIDESIGELEDIRAAGLAHEMRVRKVEALLAGGRDTEALELVDELQRLPTGTIDERMLVVLDPRTAGCCCAQAISPARRPRSNAPSGAPNHSTSGRRSRSRCGPEQRSPAGEARPEPTPTTTARPRSSHKAASTPRLPSKSRPDPALLDDGSRQTPAIPLPMTLAPITRRRSARGAHRRQRSRLAHSPARRLSTARHPCVIRAHAASCSRQGASETASVRATLRENSGERFVGIARARRSGLLWRPSRSLLSRVVWVCFAPAPWVPNRRPGIPSHTHRLVVEHDAGQLDVIAQAPGAALCPGRATRRRAPIRKPASRVMVGSRITLDSLSHRRDASWASVRPASTAKEYWRRRTAPSPTSPNTSKARHRRLG